MSNHAETFSAIVWSDNGNINGDPDNGGLPRQEYASGRGMSTDVSLKRQIRNGIAMRHPECQIAIKGGGGTIESLGEKALESLSVKLPSDFKKRKLHFEKNPADKETVRQELLKYKDIQFFGFTDTSIGIGSIRGCVQIQKAFTVAPISVQIASLSRCMAGSEKQKSDKGDNTFGNHGFAVGMNAYVYTGFISAHYANLNGLTPKDVEMLYESIDMSYSNTQPSQMRGDVWCEGIYRLREKTPSSGMKNVHGFLSVKLNDEGEVPTSMDDYAIDCDPKGFAESRNLNLVVGYDREILNAGLKKVG